MSIRVHRYGVLLAFLAVGAATGCDGQRNTVVGPTALKSTTTTGTTFRFEPATLRPEFVAGISCVGVPAFGTRIIINVGGDVILSALQFSFTDRFGVNALPRVMPIPGSAPLSFPVSAIPTSSPIPIPGAAPLPSGSPISIPGTSSFNGLSPAEPSQPLAFFLLFECGVASEGMLFVGTEVTDPRGSVRKSEFRFRVGS
jgi:hypothetical protein